MRRSNVVIVLVILLTGCASQSFKVLPPDSGQVAGEKITDAAFDQTWDTLVKNLAKSFFVINNIEKESRIINVSFSTEEPGRFIDCGTTVLTINENNHRIVISDSSQYPFVYQQGAYKFVGSALRRTALSGRVNIYLEPVSDRRTRVSANAKYVFDVSVRRFTNTGVQYDSLSDKMTFQSNAPGQLGDVKCVSRGELEKSILEMASPSGV